MMYGCIDEDTLSLRSPRMIDGDEVNSLDEAFAQAIEMIMNGVEKISICRVKYYGEDGNGWWGEIPGEEQISVNASDVTWTTEDDEEDA